MHASMALAGLTLFAGGLRAETDMILSAKQQAAVTNAVAAAGKIGSASAQLAAEDKAFALLPRAICWKRTREVALFRGLPADYAVKVPTNVCIDRAAVPELNSEGRFAVALSWTIDGRRFSKAADARYDPERKTYAALLFRDLKGDTEVVVDVKFKLGENGRFDPGSAAVEGLAGKMVARAPERISGDAGTLADQEAEPLVFARQK